ncbi:MAG TPA: fumarylacetoacetate hydrolase family protein [Gemmatirosa sp.]
MSESPVRPGKIVCVGRNYLDHARELGNDVPTRPLLFLKPPSSVIASGAAIELPSAEDSTHVDYEGEIGVVIGTRVRRADEATAVRAVRGIVALNDVSARDLQQSEPQWLRAKGYDTFCPIGPESPAPDDLASLTVVTRLNGAERQRGSAREMAFAIPMLLAYISRVMTLEPGDVVATGTPAGVGRIAPGDVVEVEVVGHSTVSNPVIASVA